METKQVIEINGIKLEVDLRTARRIDEIRVGSRVKVLTKDYSGYKVRHGVVIGFEPFQNLPTIIIAILSPSYLEAKIEFIYYNAETKETEVVVAQDDDGPAIDREEVVSLIERDIAKKRSEIAELEDRKRYFLNRFACYWESVKEAAVA